MRTRACVIFDAYIPKEIFILSSMLRFLKINGQNVSRMRIHYFLHLSNENKCNVVVVIHCLEVGLLCCLYFCGYQEMFKKLKQKLEEGVATAQSKGVLPKGSPSQVINPGFRLNVCLII